MAQPQTHNHRKYGNNGKVDLMIVTLLILKHIRVEIESKYQLPDRAF